MEPLKDASGKELDLSALLTETEDELFYEKRLALKKQISGIYLNISQWEHQKKEAQQIVEKRQAAIDKAREKLKQIQSGNWSVLKLDEDKQEKKD